MAKQDKTKGNRAVDLEGLELVPDARWAAAGKMVNVKNAEGKNVKDAEGKNIQEMVYPTLGADVEFLPGIPGKWRTVTSDTEKKYTIIAKPLESVADNAELFARILAETEIGKDWIKEEGTIENAVRHAAFKKFKFDLDNRARNEFKPEAKKRESQSVINTAFDSTKEQKRELTEGQKAALAKMREEFPEYVIN